MTIYFPDISNYQAGIDLDGALAVAIKATQGAWYTNGEYTRQVAEADHHGAFRIAYHFLETGSCGPQASYCRKVAGRTPLMLDFEEYEQGGVLHQPKMGDAAGFIDAYRALGGITHLVYLPKWYWQRIGSPSLKPLADRGMLLWSSHYGPYTDADTGAGWQPYGGMTPLIWQYTSTISFGGHAEVDFSAFRGSKYAGKQDDASVDACLAEFRSLAATGHWPPPAGEWTYPAPTRLTVVAAGHTSVRLAWHPPALPGHPVPDHYLAWIYYGSRPSRDTLLPRNPPFPRPVTGTTAQFGGLTHYGETSAGGHGGLYTVHIAAAGPDGTHVKPGVFASAQFRTG